MPGFSPWGGTVTLPTANKVYKLLDLIAALPANDQPQLDYSVGFQAVTIQENENGGTNVLYIGNQNVSATMKMAAIFATQVYPLSTVNRNAIRLDHIYLMTTGTNDIVNVGLVQ